MSQLGHKRTNETPAKAEQCPLVSKSRQTGALPQNRLMRAKLGPLFPRKIREFLPRDFNSRAKDRVLLLGLLLRCL